MSARGRNACHLVDLYCGKQNVFSASYITEEIPAAAKYARRGSPVLGNFPFIALDDGKFPSVLSVDSNVL